MAAHRENASWLRPDYKVLTLKLPLETPETGNEQLPELHGMITSSLKPPVTVSQDEFDELARKYRSLSQANASLREEYDAMVQEKSASLSSLRSQLMSIAQQELDDSLQPDSAATDPIQIEELCRLRNSVDFLQNENAAAKEALRECEERAAQRADEAKELKLRLTGIQDSMLVYEQSLSDSHAKLQRESELCSFLKQSLKDCEEKRQVSNALLMSKTQHHQIQILDLLAASAVAESSLQNELAAQQDQNSQLQTHNQSLENELSAQRAQNCQLQEKHQLLETALTAQQDENRQLQEKCQSMETQLAAEQDQNRNLYTNNQSLEIELAAQRAENDQLKEHHQSIETKLAAQQDQNSQLQTHNQSLENELSAQRAQNDQLQEKHQLLETALSAQQDENRQLQEKYQVHMLDLLAEERDRHHQLQQKHSTVLQITLDEFEGSLRTATSEFQLRLRSSKLFASEYVSNCLDSLHFAVVAVFFWKWRFVVAESSKSSSGHISTADPLQLVSDEPFQLKSAFSSYPDRQGSGDLVVSSERITPTSHTSSKNAAAHLTTSDALQLLDEVCAELSSASTDLQSLASDLQSFITSAATALNASLSESSIQPMPHLHQAYAAYLGAISQCEARLHDVNVPLVTCTQSLRDTLTSLSMAPRSISNSAFELSSLLDLPSQLSDASLAIERAVRNTEASSIELRTLLLSPTVAETGHSNTSRSSNFQQSSTSRMASERSSFNRLLGSVLSCHSRIALCANVASACLGNLSRTRILRIRKISNRADVSSTPNVKL